MYNCFFVDFCYDWFCCVKVFGVLFVINRLVLWFYM